MRQLAVAAMVAWVAGAQVGCATIFTGTSDEVLVDCDPEGATCAVIGGGGVGGLLVTASQVNAGMRTILRMVERHVSPSARETLSRVDFNELVAALVARSRVDRLPPGLVSDAASIIEGLSKGLVDDILEALGIQEIGTSPFEVRLKKGRPWGVLCFKEGYKARIELIGLRFNPVTFLNVFNLFIGCGIDIMTGAMFNLEDRVRIRLKRRD